MSTIKYYAKPVQVEAWQNDGTDAILQALRKSFFVDKIEYECVLNTEICDRGTLREYKEPIPPIYIEYYRPDGSRYKATIFPDDWFVIKDGVPMVVHDYLFKEEFFQVEEETVVSMPTLKELL